MLTMFLLAALYFVFLVVLSVYGGVGTYGLMVFAGFFLNAFFIIPAISGDSVMNLFSTHPTVEARIRALEEMERRMEF